MSYKIFEFEGRYSILKDSTTSIPRSSRNADYNQFIREIALGEATVEGPDVIEPSYVELRQAAYPSMADQLDMQYWDNVNGTTTWADAIQAVKDQYPSTITGGTTVGDVPAWVQEEADAWLFNHQTEEYDIAVKRLAQYRLADGQEEVTETVVLGSEPSVNSDGIVMVDDDGETIMVDVTEEIVTQQAIDPLPATVVETDRDGVETTVDNPKIVKDDEERAAAQAVIDATPQAVIDAYNSGE